MRRYQPLGVLILLPALALFLGAPGCSKKEEGKKSGDGVAKGDGKPADGGNGGGKKEEGGAKTELDNKEWGTLTGTVTYDGTPPEPKKIDMSQSKDRDACHADASEKEVIEQTWIVNKQNKGVANVVIYLKAPEGKYFKIHPSYQEKAKKGEHTLLHQPHCAFLPHASVFWASTYDKDTGELKPSGMKFRVLNDAKFNHNTAWSGDEDYNPKGSITLAPGKHQDLAFTADLKTPIAFKCDIHPWMNAKCWALDNPYCARTDENGKYKIENVPAGVELYVVRWHEGPKFLEGGQTGTKKRFDAKDNVWDFTVK